MCWLSIYLAIYIWNQKVNQYVLRINNRGKPSKAYPVLQASLIKLTESAVTTNASAQARCPIFGFGSEERRKPYVNPCLITYSS